MTSPATPMELCDFQSAEHPNPSMEGQKFEGFFSDWNKKIPESFVTDFFMEIIIDNFWDASFVMTEIMSEPNPAAEFQPSRIFFEKFRSVEHRIVLSPNTGSEFEGNRGTIQYLCHTAELKTLKKSNLILFDDLERLREYEEFLSERGFLFLKSTSDLPGYLPIPLPFETIAQKKTKLRTYVLLRKCSLESIPLGSVVYLDLPDYSWVDVLKERISSKMDERIVMVTFNPDSGINGFLKCLMKEFPRANVQSLHLEGTGCAADIEEHIAKDIIISRQLKKLLIFNVYKYGLWGCYCNYGILPVDLPPLSTRVEFSRGGKNTSSASTEPADDEQSATKAVGNTPKFSPDKIHIVTGAFGKIGSEIVTWMIQRGARKFYIVTDSGTSIPNKESLVQGWVNLHAEIELRSIDQSSKTEVVELLHEIIGEGPIGGFFHLEMASNEKPLKNQTARSFEIDCARKITLPLEFDRVTEFVYYGIEYFVVFSSQTAVRGNEGQTSYGYACSVLERLCERRKFKGLPALAIQWGALGDEGVEGDAGGTAELSISSYVETLDLLLQKDVPAVVGYYAIAENALKLSGASSETSATEFLAGLLGIEDLLEVDKAATLFELGVDSLMLAEVKKFLEENHDFALPTMKAYRELTFQDILDLDRKKA